MGQIETKAWTEIVDSNQALNKIATKWPKLKSRLELDDWKPEMETVKYFLWLNPDRSSVFFANQVLLVEGPTEVALVTRLVGDGKIKNAECGLYVLDCIGKHNIHRFMNLLSHLGVSHAVIHDDDDDKDEHEEINRLIEDSKHAALTLCIQRIAGKLETMLGVPSAGSPHRKPQHVLYQYDIGKIDTVKLQKFCSAVEACLPQMPATVSPVGPAMPSK